MAYEVLFDSEYIMQVMCIVDNLVLNCDFANGKSSQLYSREYLIDKLKNDLSDTFATYYDKKPDHCKKVVQETGVNLYYQIIGERNSIKELLLDRSLDYRLGIALEKCGFDSKGDKFQIYDSLSPEAHQLVHREAFGNIENLYSNNPQIEEYCRFVRSYVRTFERYVSEELKIPIEEINDKDEISLKRRLAMDPIAEISLERFDEKTKDGICKDFFDISGTILGFYNEERKDINFSLDASDNTIFHEMDHAMNNGGYARNYSRFDASTGKRLPSPRMFNEIVTELNSDEEMKIYYSKNGHALINENETTSSYRIMEPFVKEIWNNEAMRENIKYLSIESSQPFDDLVQQCDEFLPLAEMLTYIEYTATPDNLVELATELGCNDETIEKIQSSNVSRQEFISRIGKNPITVEQREQLDNNKSLSSLVTASQIAMSSQQQILQRQNTM